MATWVRRLWPVFVVGGLLAVVAILAQLGHVTIHSVPPKGRKPPSLPQVTIAPARPALVQPLQSAKPGHSGDVLTWVAVGVVVFGISLVLILTVIGVIQLIRNWWPTLRSRAAEVVDDLAEPVIEPRRQALAAVDASLTELAGGGVDARAVVIACWVRLEEVAASAGTPREPGDTPSDLIARLLSTQQVSAGALGELADLYRTARYSTRVIDETMRARALATMGRLRDELTRSYAFATGARADEQ